MSNVQQGPEQKFVAWRIVPYLKANRSEHVYYDHEKAVQAAIALDGENNWMISGITQEQLDRQSAAEQELDRQKEEGQ